MINREDQARIKDVLDSKPRTNGSERCNGAENRTTCVNEAMIRNLSFTVESITESATKAMAAQENSLDSLAKVVFGNRIALDLFYLFFIKG